MEQMRRLFEALAVGVAVIAFILTAMSIAMMLIAGHKAGTRDYIEYWAAGRQLTQHRNPYDAAATLKLERAEGLPDHILSMVMGNAPPALLLTYPLGFVSPSVGQYAWTLLLIVSFVVSVNLIAETLGSKRQIVKLLGYSFAPALVCIPVGQMALFVLLGLTLFLRLYQTRPMAAGAALWLCLLKPQLFLPFGVVLCLWIWRKRQFGILAGTLIALIASIVLIWILDPNCWSQYRAMMQLMRYDKAGIPCLSMVLRDSVPGFPAIQYLPCVAGTVWAVAFFWRNQDRWRWMEQGSTLLLVSLLVAPYTWFVDQCVAIPALLYAAAVTRSRVMIAVLALASVVIESGPLAGHDLLHSRFYLWTTPFYLAWYLLATRTEWDTTAPKGFEPHFSDVSRTPERAQV